MTTFRGSVGGSPRAGLWELSDLSNRFQSSYTHVVSIQRFLPSGWRRLASCLLWWPGRFNHLPQNPSKGLEYPGEGFMVWLSYAAAPVSADAAGPALGANPLLGLVD